MKCPYANDDGAYVVGALAPADRAEFERHLSGCRSCRNAVAELAVLPGLLSRLDAAAAEQMSVRPVTADGSRVQHLLVTAGDRRRREQRRSRMRVGGALLATACLALLIGFGIDVVRRPEPPHPPATMASMWPATPATPGPVVAEVGLVDMDGGTAVWMHCAYQSRSDYLDAWTFRLYAYDHDGHSEQVGSWVAGPGDELIVDGVIRFTRAELARLELHRGDGTALLIYTL